ncbi:unnamed protein product [Linum tenue]|uniref:Transmembrane protein n=1 Tax=Linum tenue TaxID=586396 RepID=A0AAV0REH1_9ROSI|nr:unnamed protein product [Linum tenue]
MAEPAETSSSSDHTAADFSAHENLKQFPEPKFSGFPAYPNAHLQMFPVLYPTIVPGVTSFPNQQQITGGAGIYAVPVPPFNGPIAGLPANTLIPLSFSIPTTPPPEAGSAGDHGPAGQQPQHQQQAHAPHRQVAVRRFQIAFQLDLFLILKLAAVIFLFNQDGSRQRLIVLVLFASLVYLYQTGALTPLVRWLSQSMQRAAAPPRRPQAAARAENAPAARLNENAPLAEGDGEEENRAGVDGNQRAENENVEGGDGGNPWWGIVKEVQMIVFGFITSLLPGFHNID